MGLEVLRLDSKNEGLIHIFDLADECFTSLQQFYLLLKCILAPFASLAVVSGEQVFSQLPLQR